MYHRKKGFTLIELLVVISIIAVLLSILMPALTKAKEHAKAVICSSRQHHQGIMFLTYATAYDGKFPPHDNAGSDYVKSPGGTDMTLLLEEYAGKTEFFYCPLDPHVSPDYLDSTGSNGYGAWDFADPPESCGYVIISYAWYVNFGAGSGTSWRYYNGFRLITKMEEANSSRALGSDMLFIYPPMSTSGKDPLDWEFGKEDYAGKEWWRTGVWMGHPWGVGGINVLGSDGSVEKHRWAEAKLRYDYGHTNYDVVYY